jgi:hypothetical protein
MCFAGLNTGGPRHRALPACSLRAAPQGRNAIVFELGLGEEHPGGTPPDLIDEPRQEPSRLWNLALADLRAGCLSKATKATSPTERQDSIAR